MPTGKVAHYALPHYALVRHVFSASVRGAHPSTKGYDPAVRGAAAKRPDAHLILCGLIIFGIGLFKKTWLADGIPAAGSSLAFGPATPSFDQAWIGALAYTSSSISISPLFSGHGDRDVR